MPEAATAQHRAPAAGAQPLLAVSGLEAWYGESHILHGVNFHVHEGEVVTLLGRNGAGKSTTLKSIAGAVTPTSGRVLAEGDYATVSNNPEVREAYMGVGHA